MCLSCKDTRAIWHAFGEWARRYEDLSVMISIVPSTCIRFNVLRACWIATHDQFLRHRLMTA